MEQMQFAKHMMDIFKTSFTAACDTLPIFNNEEQDNDQNVQEVHENPNELGYRVRG